MVLRTLGNGGEKQRKHYKNVDISHLRKLNAKRWCRSCNDDAYHANAQDGKPFFVGQMQTHKCFLIYRSSTNILKFQTHLLA